MRTILILIILLSITIQYDSIEHNYEDVLLNNKTRSLKKTTKAGNKHGKIIKPTTINKDLLTIGVNNLPNIKIKTKKSLPVNIPLNYDIGSTDFQSSLHVSEKKNTLLLSQDLVIPSIFSDRESSNHTKRNYTMDSQDRVKLIKGKYQIKRRSDTQSRKLTKRFKDVKHCTNDTIKDYNYQKESLKSNEEIKKLEHQYTNGKKGKHTKQKCITELTKYKPTLSSVSSSNNKRSNKHPNDFDGLIHTAVKYTPTPNKFSKEVFYATTFFSYVNPPK